MALADTWTGSKLAQSYQKPKSAQDRAAESIALNSDLQKRREAVTSKIEDLIKAQRGGYELNKLAEALNQRFAVSTDPERKYQPRRPYYDPNKIETDVQKLQKNIGDQLPGIKKNIEELDKYLQKADIPGVGVGQKVLPDWMRSDEGSRVQQLVTDLYRAKVYMDSGKQINDKEAKDEMKTLGIEFGSKESSFRQGVKGLRDKVVEIIKNKEAAYRPEVKKVFKERGGISASDIPNITSVAPKSKLTPEQEARRQELLRKAGK